VSHSETVQLTLQPDSSGTFGFTLQGNGTNSLAALNAERASTDLTSSTIIAPYPVIGYVEPNSAAERCDVLQPGDRILSVNDRSLEGLSLEEARQIIKEAGNNLRMTIEFEVADAIMLSSGTFQVKLLKKNLNLGLSVACELITTLFQLFFYYFLNIFCFKDPKLWKSDYYPYISNIKKGSVAFRYFINCLFHENCKLYLKLY
jgi:hypothetical protein